MFGWEVDKAAQAHALAEYPREACGLVSRGVYVPSPNVARDPDNGFELPSSALIEHKPVAAIIHSHCAPQHGREPSAADMQNQIDTGVPVYGIVLTDGKTAQPPLWFGDFLLDEHLIGREFCHGVRDCYSLLRSYLWQGRRVKLPEFPRSMGWWRLGGDLYREGFAKAGFREIAPDAVLPGDVVLMQLRERVPYHCGIILAGGMLLHHLPNRLSRAEPAARWRKHFTHWLRYG